MRAGQTPARPETDKLRFEVARGKADVDRPEQDFGRFKSFHQRNLLLRKAYDRTRTISPPASPRLTSPSSRCAKIRSPSDSVITARFIERGDQIQANMQSCLQ